MQKNPCKVDTVPKCRCAKLSPFKGNAPCKKSLCKNVAVQKCRREKMSLVQKSRRAKVSTRAKVTLGAKVSASAKKTRSHFHDTYLHSSPT